MRRTLLSVGLAVVLATALLPGILATPEAQTTRSEAVAWTRVKAGFDELPDDLDGVAASLDAEVVLRSDRLDFAVFAVDDPAAGVAARGALADRDDVRWATFDGRARVQSETRDALSPNPPNDPLWDDQYGPELIHAPEAWEQEKGRDGVTVAVLDTGVHASHEDLLETCTPDCAQAPYDVYGHGTHVAGIVAAETNNEAGIAGIAQVDTMSVKALSDAGSTWWSQIAVAIVDATVAGADVISMSLGGDCDFVVRLCPDVEAAVDFAWDHGVVLVAASGNSGHEDEVFEPASMDHVVAVGAVDETKTRAGFSNGGDRLDLVAPGVDVLSSVPPGSLLQLFCPSQELGYAYCDGTSMAAPHVSGVAALALSHCPDQTNAEVVDTLNATAEDLGTSGWDNLYGHGLVRADNVVQATSVC